MALSDEQTVACFQILDVPLNTTVNVVSLGGALSSSTDFSAAGQSAAKTAIDTSLAALSADRETVLKTELNRWIALGSRVVRIEGGGVGGISGASVDPEDERAKIRQRVLIILPYYKLHEIIAKQMQEQAPAASLGRL